MDYRCVSALNVTQAYATIAADELTGNGLYGAQTHIEYCLAYDGEGGCPLSLKQAVNYASQPVNTNSGVGRRAVGYKYMAKITNVKSWPGQDEISFIELVLFDRENSNAIVAPFGPKGVCELLMKTDLRCVKYGQCLDVNRLQKDCSKFYALWCALVSCVY